MLVTTYFDALQADLSGARPIYLEDLRALVGPLYLGKTISRTSDAALSFGGYRTTTYRFGDSLSAQDILEQVDVEVIDSTQAVIRLTLYLNPASGVSVEHLIQRYELCRQPERHGAPGMIHYVHSYAGGNIDVQVPAPDERRQQRAVEIHIFADPRVSSPRAYHAPV
ncbi:hypothetical protein [Dyella sp.]|uniref:hypothetical protein n=1 Tax=Dyella sp. TaxID=1869338 RepID=UPI002ED49B9C